MVEDTCQTLGVELHRGQLMLRSGAADGLGEAVLRLAQAAVRVSDLWFTLRTRAVETVADEVTDWLVEKEISFDRAVRQYGRSGQSWTVDYQTRTDDRTSLIFLLSTGSRGAARRIAEHVLAGCVDLSHLKVSQSHLAFVSLFDDTEDVWREEDFSLVEQQSQVARWSRPDEFERILLAACGVHKYFWASLSMSTREDTRPSTLAEALPTAVGLSWTTHNRLQVNEQSTCHTHIASGPSPRPRPVCPRCCAWPRKRGRSASVPGSDFVVVPAAVWEEKTRSPQASWPVAHRERATRHQSGGAGPKLPSPDSLR